MTAHSATNVIPATATSMQARGVRLLDRIDPPLLVIVYILLLIFVPSSRGFPALGGVGAPATLFGAFLFGIWVLLKLTRSRYLSRLMGPTHVAWMVFAWATVASYTVAMGRPLFILEMNGADRALISLASWSGVVLMIADGCLKREQLERVLRCLALSLGGVAAIALSQYMLKVNWYARIPFPGLSEIWTPGTDERSGFIRVTGSSVHAIEYGVIQTMGVALALHFARHATSLRSKILWWTDLGLILTTLPLTIARSPVVGMAVVVAMLVPTWPRQFRRRALVATPFALLALRVLFPGVLGTVVSLFTWISSDPSTQGRTEDYTAMAQLLEGRAVFGMGPGTLIPDLYLILDNQYLGTLLTMGVMGVLALVGVLATSIALSVIVRSRVKWWWGDGAASNLQHALTTGVAVATVEWGVFDGLGFQQAAGVLLILLGGIAASARIYGVGQLAVKRTPQEASAWRRFVTMRRPLLISAVSAGAVMALCLSAGPPQGSFLAESPLLLHPKSTRNGLFGTDLMVISSLVTDQMRSTATRQLVESRGGTGTYEVAQGTGSLEALTDRQGYGPLIKLRAVDPDPEVAMRTMTVATEVLRESLREAQLASGAPDDGTMVVAMEVARPRSPLFQTGAESRQLAGAVLLAMLTGLAAFLAVETRPAWRVVDSG